ncbi:MAG: hypothetical protein QNJ15_04495 [Erythrobacter sp.]|nr:hypothetical protein [Erythrobacter sp.]
MNGGILALMIAGLVGFLAGAYLAATGERPVGIALMGLGLIFQVLTLRQLKAIKKGSDDAG